MKPASKDDAENSCARRYRRQSKCRVPQEMKPPTSNTGPVMLPVPRLRKRCICQAEVPTNWATPDRPGRPR
ncbi:hypothetical protein Forpe1208_v010838 [Fusarium oxysporum f. sp. rapae]|uniref:Uncharacterized protein n=1 Tax=Fusarium oxysporum f. sp. rapae TaxID=485398 RepID=A0A8J5U536_FUSOX|nr:hypothetical protein Forpe1208_v010838 [Fusarium oxysporum f. sp. rapae]